MTLSDNDRAAWEAALQGVLPTLSNRYRSDPPRHRRFERNDPTPRTLDLHGLPIHIAFHETRRFLDTNRHAGTQHVTIITGRSGAINDEFTRWMENHGVERIERLRNGGSYRIKF